MPCNMMGWRPVRREGPGEPGRWRQQGAPPAAASGGAHGAAASLSPPSKPHPGTSTCRERCSAPIAGQNRLQAGLGLAARGAQLAVTHIGFCWRVWAAQGSKAALGRGEGPTAAAPDRLQHPVQRETRCTHSHGILVQYMGPASTPAYLGGAARTLGLVSGLPVSCLTAGSSKERGNSCDRGPLAGHGCMCFGQNSSFFLSLTSSSPPSQVACFAARGNAGAALELKPTLSDAYRWFWAVGRTPAKPWRTCTRSNLA